MKYIYRRLECFQNNKKGSKVENMVKRVVTNHIQRQSSRDFQKKLQTSREGKI